MPYVPNTQIVRGLTGPTGPAGPVGPQGSGASTFEYTVASDSAVGATTIVLDRTVTGMVQGGSWVAIGATLTTCEVREVTGISSATLTLPTALRYAHTAGEFVWVLKSADVPLEWFGCKANTPTFNSFTGLQQALNDIALVGGGYGLMGHGQRYYSSTPLVVYDSTFLDRITLTVKAPLSIDPTIGLRNSEPDQFFVTMAGQRGTVTAVNTTTDTITLSETAGGTIGDRLIFYPIVGATLPAPLEAGRGYYLKTAVGLDYTISIDRDGAPLDLTTTGTGTTVFYSTGASRMRWDSVSIEGGTTRALNGVCAVLQQPSIATSLRVEEFPGPKGLLVINGQQAAFYNIILIDGAIGLNCQSMQFLYMHGSSFEDCDVLVKADQYNLTGTIAGSRDLRFSGSHFESSGGYTRTRQAVLGNALVSAGTFTITFSGQTTSAIAYNASAATIQTALEALSNINPGDVVCTDKAGGLPGGYVELDFRGGQYSYSVVPTGSVTSTLTGGSYSWNYFSPDSRNVSIAAGTAGLSLDGGVISSGSLRPDGSSPNDLVVVESGVATDSSYTVKEFYSLGQGGYAINDIPNGIQIPWADNTGAAERLQYYSYGGRHGGSKGTQWILAAIGGDHVVWDGVTGEFQFYGSANLRFGDTGPLLFSGSGSPEGAVAAPVGSLFLRSDGGAGTSLYVKQSGTGNTGWVGK